MLILSLIVSILICFAVPIGGFLLLKRQGGRLLRAFFVGILTFTVSQMLIRIPILTAVFPSFAWFGVLQLNPWMYGIFLGSTAALFEEGARWIFMKLFLKDRLDIQNGLAFGLGHGGIEAMLIVGVNAIIYLFMTLAGNGILSPAESGNVFMGGVERLFAMIFHVGASLIVMYGLSVRRAGRYLFLAFLLHMLLDASSVILTMVFGVGVLTLEIIVAVFAVLVLGYGVSLFHRKKHYNQYSHFKKENIYENFEK